MANKTQINDFIETLASLAQAEYRRRKVAGLNWVLPSVCIGQAAQETGWGTSAMMVKANAYFGIKATSSWTGKVYSSSTKECYDGLNFTTETALFRAYDSLADSVADYYSLICDTSLYKAARNIADANEAVMAIKKCGYATDPAYASSVQNIIKQYNLTQYDTVDTSVKDAEKLEIDGYWGIKTTTRAQEVFKTTVDGIVSKQIAVYKDSNPGLGTCFNWNGTSGDGGSQLIKAIQMKVGVKQDGHIGPDTIKAMQKWLGTTKDGYVSSPSLMVKAFQTWLNKQ